MPDRGPLDVRRLEPAARERALASVVAAFATDPLLRWVWPEDMRYDACAPSFFGVLLDLRRAGGEVWVADGGAAVAMWDPPGGRYVTPTRDPWLPLQASFTAAERARWTAFDAAALVPADEPPHWYLGVLATAPASRGQGLATAVTAPVLAAADRTATAVYLETASEANVGFYARLGFLVDREVDIADIADTACGGPRCWLLRREPAGA